jgi:RNA polymerase sigma factor (sigma-70 family)
MSFDATRWSMVLAGRHPGGTRYQDAWRYLAETFAPLIQQTLQCYAPDVTTAIDWRDEFIAEWFSGCLDGADPSRGSFRAYLRAALHRYGVQCRKRWQMQWQRFPPLVEHLEAESLDHAEFDRDFARRLLERALEALHDHQQRRIARGNREYDLIRCLLASDCESYSHAQLAWLFGLSVKAVERQLARARRRLRLWISAELELFCTTESERRCEIISLLVHCRHVFSD